MTVRQLLENLDSRELSEWIAYYSLEPFGEFRDDYRSAVIAATIANVNRRKNSRPFKVDDFMLKVKREQTVEEQKMIISALAQIFSQRKEDKK